MLRISYPVALGLVAFLALLPTGIALAFFDGPEWLYGLPFSQQVIAIAALATIGAICLILFEALRAREASPTRYLVARVQERPSLVLTPPGLILLAAYPSSAFSYLKDAIPKYVPFYSDPLFVMADRWLFLGHDPWRVSHALLGDYGTIFLDKVYIAWFSLIPFLGAAIVASSDRTFQLRGILTLFFIWIGLGAFAAMALSSSGPVFYQEFYGSDYYVPLMTELRRADSISPLAMLPIADWLLEMRESGQMGSGISAMPSVHVAIAYFTYLVVWEKYRKAWAVAAAGCFTLLIWIGSFHLAWHYAWDGIVSIICVWAFWRLLGRVEIKQLEPDIRPLPAVQET
ncbi:phosphatase PAP2 family protein [Altererythrobacter sp.]|uniref:phosphatase PAP2 family protein n=1 Tax=Altererythrobacter sp. TaxID=1872480 RepID=UPI003D03F498